MAIKNYTVTLSVDWQRPNCSQGAPYQWGSEIPRSSDKCWGRKDLVYRWIRNSDMKTAYVGKAETALFIRINQYIKPGPSQSTNWKVNREQQLLATAGDFLYLVITDSVPGFDLALHQELLWAEALLTALERPYLQ